MPPRQIAILLLMLGIIAFLVYTIKLMIEIHRVRKRATRIDFTFDPPTQK